MAAIVLIAFAVNVSVAKAEDLPGTKILVFGANDNGFEGNNTAESLRSLGLSVDRSPSLPADLTPYGYIWYVDAYQAMPTESQTALAEFLARGGSVYLTGERPCCEPLNVGVQNVLRAVLKDTNVGVGGLGDIPGPYTFNTSALGEITKSPNVLVDFVPDSPGGMSGISGVDSRNVLATNGTTTVGAVWDESDMKVARGRVALLMDIDWLGKSTRLPVIQNIQNFLSKGRNCSNDGGVPEISWSAQSPSNCVTLVAPRTVRWSVSSQLAQPTVVVETNGLNVDCRAVPAAAGAAAVECRIPNDVNGNGALIVTATAGSQSVKRYYQVRPKNDSRNVPVPFALESDWWTWPDADDDGLPDKWENDGVWVGEHLLNLPGLGARANHKDLFLRMDFQEGQEFDQQVVDYMVETFTKSPLTNPDQQDGVNLHVERGRSIPESIVGDYDLEPSHIQRVTTYSGFTSSPQYGGNGVPHIFKHLLNFKHPDNADEVIGRGLVKGNFAWTAFPVDEWHAAFKTGMLPGPAANFARASNATHELGHLLGLLHHGAETTPNSDPKYKSVMSYKYSNFGVTGGPLNLVHTVDYSRTPAVNLDWKVGQGHGALTFVTGQHGEEADFYEKSFNERIPVKPENIPEEITLAQHIQDASPQIFDSFAKQFGVEGTPRFPTLKSASATTVAGRPVSIDLDAADPEGKALRFLIDQQPAHGAVAVEGKLLTYTPAVGFAGEDSVVLRATNDVLSSDPATLEFTVTPLPVNNPPVATSQSVSATSGVSTPLRLLGTDADGDQLAFAVLTNPAHGTLSGTAPDLTYTPQAGFAGTDSFTFKVNDGKADSAPATVAITVTSASTCRPAPVLDSKVSADVAKTTSQLTSPPLATAGDGELLLAFIAVDGQLGRTQKVAAVTGAGLRWTRATRSDSLWGTTEVWQAYARKRLHRDKVTAYLGASGHGGSITVVAYKGAAQRVGSTQAAAGLLRPPAVTITTSKCESAVWAIGHDSSRARRPDATQGQTVQHEFLDVRNHDSYWVKSLDKPVAANTKVVFSDPSIKGDLWTYSAVEVPPGS